MKRKKLTPTLIKSLLKKLMNSSDFSRFFSHQPTKIYPIVTATDSDQVIVKTPDFYLTIQCAPENGTKKDLYKNLIKSPV